MKRLSHVVLAWFALCVASSVSAAPPDGVRAVYDIYKGGLRVGQIEENYTREQDRYTLNSTTTPLGLLAVFKPEKIFIDSRGAVVKQGLRPLQFGHRRERDTSRDSKAEFDWEARQLALIHDGRRDMVALPDGAQDRLSAMYQFMFWALRPDGALEFPMTNGVKLDSYRYAVARGPRLKTPAGTFDTLYLDNQAKSGESRTEIWLATQRHNLPCKMVITDSDGSQLTQVLSSLAVKP